jgi:hypothetical protein
MIERAVTLLGRGPGRPAVRLVDDVAVRLAVQLRFELALLL